MGARALLASGECVVHQHYGLRAVFRPLNGEIGTDLCVVLGERPGGVAATLGVVSETAETGCLISARDWDLACQATLGRFRAPLRGDAIDIPAGEIGAGTWIVLYAGPSGGGWLARVRYDKPIGVGARDRR